MDEYFNRIALFLRHKSRLSFAGHKRSILRRRLENRLTQLNLPDFCSYWSFLLANPAEEANLYDLATTNETSFFRNWPQFSYLRDFICPELEQRALESSRKIRVLSAGCSTGEEAYSIAMTMLDSFRSPGLARLEIVAGDISESCLQVARVGFYDNDRLVKLPSGYRKRFMEECGDGATVKAPVKRYIRFVRMNLDELMKEDQVVWGAGQDGFDIIFCRNVMIYFAPECQQVLVDTLHRLLLPGGYLFTGDAEPLHLFNHEFKPVETAGCLIYRKTENISDDNTI